MPDDQELPEQPLAAVLASGLALTGEMLILAARQARIERALAGGDGSVGTLDAPLTAQEETWIAGRADDLVAAWLDPLTQARAHAA